MIDGKSIDRENAVANLEQNIRWIEDNEHHQFPGWGNVVVAMRDAVELLKEQESEAKWIYGEDKMGVDGWHCSECDFFEPWFYEFTDDIDFIRFYGHCPSCGRKMTSYTGRPTENRG